MAADSNPMTNSSQKGFTLIELLVAMSVSAVLLGIGIPSFSGAIKNTQVSSDYNELIRALYRARSESVKSSDLVTVCPKLAVDSQQCGTGINDWKHGWIVFTDHPEDLAESAANVGSDDEIISIHPVPRSKNIITGIGTTNRTKGTATDRNYIRYNNRGESNWANGSFLLCSDEDEELSRAINIAPTGDIRPGRTSDSEYPRNVFNEEACTL